MMNEFRCPEIDFREDNEGFFIPGDCYSPKLEKLQLSSPNSCLPKEQLDELVEKIEEANQLLLDLDQDEDDATEQSPDRFDRIFHRLQDQLVNINVERVYRVVKRRNRNPIQLKRRSHISGVVSIVGRDFVLLENKNRKFIVPYDRIIHITRTNNSHEKVHYTLDLDAKLRRALTFHFGEVVSRSPALILHFFTVELKFFLANFEIKNVRIISNDLKLSGKIIDTNENFLELYTGKRKTISIKYSDIDFIYFE
ncbi:hypothetical protein [Bacillus kwashiorkori]|uniref:hypothetical protein n=1 Tax=Bacillus kwashiorkori TaxID=1522318 RepID=UPI000781A2C6|nr:hypothetical protein [Bacillus kwashiorkori]